MAHKKLETDIYEDLYMYTTTEKFYFKPVQSNQLILIIDRLSGAKKLEPYSDQVPKNAGYKKICGILGEIKLIAGPYLVVVTKKKRVGPIMGHSIWLVEETEIIPFRKSLLHLTTKQMDMNRQYQLMLECVLDTPYFYFSYSFDITHSLQRLFCATHTFSSMLMHDRADKRFLWNHHLLKQFCTIPDSAYFCLPVMHGFISINPFTFVNNHTGKEMTFLWTLISRRSCKRVGTRLFVRGIDEQGNVANFVETEQIVEFDDQRASYVQIRGSIPLFWNQYPDLHLKPKIQIEEGNHAQACAKHFDEQVSHYNDVVVVNLIDQHGREAALGRKYVSVLEEILNKHVKYGAYDFHHECKNMQWHKLHVLINRLGYEQDKFKYFLGHTATVPISLQTGVFRTNCIDCLDRTNVVQSMLAWRNLTQIFTQMGLITHPDATIPSSFVYLFKNAWADNADYLSLQYSAASALKTDYTRTGKRTSFGLLKDGWNTLIRYYRNNLRDGFRQDALDLFVGNYVVQEGEAGSVPCPIDKLPSWKYVIFTVIFLGAIAMFFANAIFSTEYSTGTLLSLLFWAAMVLVTWITILHYGNEFIDYPNLCASFKLS